MLIANDIIRSLMQPMIAMCLGRLVVPQIQIDNNPFPMHTIELQNPKVLIRSNQQREKM